MIISCPSCQKRYLIDETILTEQGREVRCGVCSTTWNECSKPPAISISSIEIDTVFNDIRTKKKSKTVPALFFVLTVLTLALTGAFAMRYTLLTYFPALKPIYTQLGINIHPRQGLRLTSLVPLQTTLHSKPALVVKGVIANASHEIRQVTELNITLYGSCDDAPWWYKLYGSIAFLTESDKTCKIDRWTHYLSHSRLMPGENLAFETVPHELKSIPSSIHVNF